MQQMQTVNINENTQPLLTIAIPTFNRAEFLELCLQRIREELDSLDVDWRKLIRIYVSNNASTDNTTQVISRHQKIDAGLFEVVHNSENIGGERNVTQCYASATTPYVWVLGDDDVILPGGLQKVISTLLIQKPDILYVGNYHFIDNYLDTKRARTLGRRGISIYGDPLKFARRTNVMLTFISALIVRNKVGLDYHPEVAAGSNLPQLGWVLPLLRNGDRFAIIENWVVAGKGGNSGGYSLIKTFAESLQRIVNALLQDRPALVKAIVNGTILNFFPGYILHLRSGSRKYTDIEIADGLRKAFSGNWRYNIFLVPLISMPLYFSRYYYYLTRMIRLLIGPLLI